MVPPRFHQHSIRFHEGSTRVLALRGGPGFMVPQGSARGVGWSGAALREAPVSLLPK